jgi:hypothetical protein
MNRSILGCDSLEYFLGGNSPVEGANRSEVARTGKAEQPQILNLILTQFSLALFDVVYYLSGIFLIPLSGKPMVLCPELTQSNKGTV